MDPVKLENMLVQMLPEAKVHLYGTEENNKDREMYREKANGSEIPADDKLLSALSEILGLDLKTAIQNCGSPEVFKNAYLRFISAIPEKTEKICGFLDSGDIENYTILVHSLKSSAALVGAMKLSEEAALLEKAGNAGNMDYIRDNTGRVMELYASYRNGAEVLKNDDSQENTGEGVVMDNESFAEALEAVMEFAQAFDMKSASDVLSGIEKENLSDEMKETLKTIRGFIRQADRDGVMAFIKG